MTISNFTVILSFGFLSLLCYIIVCVYALLWPNIQNKILISCCLYNFVSNHKELTIDEKHIINTLPLAIPVAFLLNQLVFLSKRF